MVAFPCQRVFSRSFVPSLLPVSYTHLDVYKRQGKARLNSYDKLLNEDVKEKEEKLEIFIPNGPRLGNKVIEAKHVAKAYGDKLLFDDLNFMLPPNGIVGVIGPNGAGKTTLFRLIMGLETVDKGCLLYTS